MNDPQFSRKDNQAGMPETQGNRQSVNESSEITPEEPGSAADASDSELKLAPLESEPVVAELVDGNYSQDSGSTSQSYFKHGYAGVPPLGNRPKVDLANEFHNMSAIGGAVGAFVLGIWSIVCSIITPFSSINAIMALLLGFYGMQSKQRRLAIIGMVLGLVGLALSLIETNEILSRYFAEEAAA